MSGSRIRSRLDTTQAIATNPSKPNQPDYFPPCQLILDKLGVAAADLANARVQVSGPGLRRLIAEYARTTTFDADWYAKANPDVEGARLAGDVQSLHEHFIAAGYLEGRLPQTLPFDPGWYHRHYQDISSVFHATDTEAMRTHFLTKGYFEGRVGSEATLVAAEAWWRLTDE